MTEYILQLGDQQLALAEQMVAALLTTLKPRLSDALRRKVAEAGVTQADIDEEAMEILLHQDMRRDVLLAIEGYTDWLASQLWRRRLAQGSLSKAEPVPPCEPGTQAAIVERYPVDGALLSLVIEKLHERSCDLPIVGKLARGLVLVNTAALEKWAEYYEW